MSYDTGVYTNNVPLFKTEDNIPIFENEKAYWCGYRFSEWRYIGGIKANKEQVKVLDKNNKVFSTPILAKDFINRINKTICVGRWTELPESCEKYSYNLFYDSYSDNDMHYLVVSILHLDNNIIICDYLKTIKLNGKYKIDLDSEINNSIQELSSYFNNCKIK